MRLFSRYFPSRHPLHDLRSNDKRAPLSLAPSSDQCSWLRRCFSFVGHSIRVWGSTRPATVAAAAAAACNRSPQSTPISDVKLIQRTLRAETSVARMLLDIKCSDKCRADCKVQKPTKKRRERERKTEGMKHKKRNAEDDEVDRKKKRNRWKMEGIIPGMSVGKWSSESIKCVSIMSLTVSCPSIDLYMSLSVCLSGCRSLCFCLCPTPENRMQKKTSGYRVVGFLRE